eukprot:2347698-Prymnesium_polylepis.1
MPKRQPPGDAWTAETDRRSRRIGRSALLPSGRSCHQESAAAMLSVGSIAVLSMWPTPPVQTPVQAAAWARANSEAKAASDAATPQVLSLFGSPAFQTALAACCPEVAGLSASELLDRYRAEARVAELAHNFPAMPSSGSAHHHWVDETIALVETYPWFLNQWQAAL